MMAATELGGGERVILEARACGVPHWVRRRSPNLNIKALIATDGGGIDSPIPRTSLDAQT